MKLLHSSIVSLTYAITEEPICKLPFLQRIKIKKKYPLVTRLTNLPAYKSRILYINDKKAAEIPDGEETVDLSKYNFFAGDKIEVWY